MKDKQSLFNYMLVLYSKSETLHVLVHRQTTQTQTRHTCTYTYTYSLTFLAQPAVLFCSVPDVEAKNMKLLECSRNSHQRKMSLELQNNKRVSQLASNLYKVTSFLSHAKNKSKFLNIQKGTPTYRSSLPNLTNRSQLCHERYLHTILTRSLSAALLLASICTVTINPDTFQKKMLIENSFSF